MSHLGPQHHHVGDRGQDDGDDDRNATKVYNIVHLLRKLPQQWCCCKTDCSKTLRKTQIELLHEATSHQTWMHSLHSLHPEQSRQCSGQLFVAILAKKFRYSGKGEIDWQFQRKLTMDKTGCCTHKAIRLK